MLNHPWKLINTFKIQGYFVAYLDHWKNAIARSERYNLQIPEHTVEPHKTYLSQKTHEEFPYVVRDGLGNLEVEDVFSQCMAIHYRLVPVIEGWLGCPALFTLGWIDDGTMRGLFKFDETFIERSLVTGPESYQVKMHAWITLPSLEVIDMSLSTTFAVMQKNPELYGRVIANKADALNGFSYVPMLIGEDFLLKAGLMKQINFFVD
jgi:hypothetical protein